MDLNKYKHLFKKYKIQPCKVELERTFVRIRMRCSVKSTRNGEKLLCFLRQDDTNTNQFTIQIKRKKEIRNKSRLVSIQEKPSLDLHKNDWPHETLFTEGTDKHLSFL